MSTISVIIPVYNVEPYLPRCIDSILAQTYTDFELILVDDGSPDNCGAICDEYATKDSRIKVIHKENGGVSTARNAGLDAAIGEYVVFVDSDDWVERGYLEALSSPSADLVIACIDFLEPNGNPYYRFNFSPAYYEEGKINYKKLYEEISLYGPYGKRFKTKIIKECFVSFPINVKWGEDGVFISDYLKSAKSISVIEKCDYNHISYVEENRLSNNLSLNIIDMVCSSRKYCADNMKTICPEQYEVVRDVCYEDAKGNCAYFLNRLFDSDFSISKKVEYLKHYAKHQAVQELLRFPNCLKKTDVLPKDSFANAYFYFCIISRKICLKQRARSVAYKFYSAQPIAMQRKIKKCLRR